MDLLLDPFQKGKPSNGLIGSNGSSQLFTELDPMDPSPRIFLSFYYYKIKIKYNTKDLIFDQTLQWIH